MTKTAKLPEGTRGFDCNTKVSLAIGKKFYAAGYRFAVRYVRRATSRSIDITGSEMVALLEAGLSVMLVQHVAPPGWHPTAVLGSAYGTIAAEHAAQAGYPLGATLWCDLEEVDPSSSPLDVIAFCNSWHDRVKAAGFTPGLYVGYGCGLTARQLYRNLRFKAYWSAYNLNIDNYPATRGVQMRQKPYPKPGQRVAGVPFQYDENVIGIDELGGSPILCVPPFDL